MPANTNDDEFPFFKEFWNYLVWLHMEWALYRALFGHSPERMEELNEKTGHVVRIFQDTLLDVVLLSIARLFDPAKTRGQANLSFPRAIQELGLAESPILTVLRDHLKDLKARVAPILEHRNKRIAHTDERVALEIAQVAGVSRRDISEAVKGVDEFFNQLRHALGRGPCDFKYPIDKDQAHRADRLLRVIRRGNAALEAERKKRRDAYIEQHGFDVPENFDPDPPAAPLMP